MKTKEELTEILRLHKLWLEDNENGVKAAVGAGCRVVCVANPDEVNIELLLPLIEEEDQR